MLAFEILSLEMLMKIFLISKLCREAIVCEDASIFTLSIAVKSFEDMVRGGMISFIEGKLAVCLISEENSSKRVLT